jgi:hypothetical protein
MGRDDAGNDDGEDDDEGGDTGHDGGDGDWDRPGRAVGLPADVTDAAVNRMIGTVTSLL